MENARTEDIEGIIEQEFTERPNLQIVPPIKGNDAIRSEIQYRYVNKPVYSTIKRILDVALSVIALVALSPLLLLVSILIVLDDPKGGPIFKQQRSGLHGKPFTFYKFRSMVMDAEALKEQLMQHNEANGPVFKIENDPRITKIGLFMRKTSLDELPQLWNIICGDMSIVGPRPLPIKESEACTPYQQQRLDIKPGLTCYWQAGGRDHSDFNAWVALDLQYIMDRSLWTDFKIILKTVGCVFNMEGE